MADSKISMHNTIFAPQPYDRSKPIVFLSGTIRTPSPSSSWLGYLTSALSYLHLTTSPPLPPQFSNWRDDLTETLSHLPVTVLNPHRPDWDNSWIPLIHFPPFKEQVEWELDGMEAADVLVVFFDSHTDAPITLLELGLFARHKGEKCVVGIAKGYSRMGNVQVICERFGVELVEGKEGLMKAVLGRLKHLDVGMK